MMREIPSDTLCAIERHFHALIRQRAGTLIDEHGLQLPNLSELLGASESKAWFPIPGMYGGFRYWLEGQGADTRLITESWCRIADGSGQRHEVTVAGSRLVEEGFV